MKRHIAILLVLIFVFCMAAKPASANITSYSSEKTTPNFTSCLNPQGTVIADYHDGIHGIAGNQNTFTGSDKVFKDQSTGAVTQCFCPTNGQGMQTNWMKAENFSQDEIKTYESHGWVYIPVGSDWGLDPAPYLAQNNSFSCLATAIVESTSVATANSASSNGNTNTNN